MTETNEWACQDCGEVTQNGIVHTCPKTGASFTNVTGHEGDISEAHCPYCDHVETYDPGLSDEQVQARMAAHDQVCDKNPITARAVKAEKEAQENWESLVDEKCARIKAQFQVRDLLIALKDLHGTVDAEMGDTDDETGDDRLSTAMKKAGLLIPPETKGEQTEACGTCDGSGSIESSATGLLGEVIRMPCGECGTPDEVRLEVTDVETPTAEVIITEVMVIECCGCGKQITVDKGHKADNCVDCGAGNWKAVL